VIPFGMRYLRWSNVDDRERYSARRAPNVVRRPELGVLSNGVGQGRCTQQ